MGKIDKAAFESLRHFKKNSTEQALFDHADALEAQLEVVTKERDTLQISFGANSVRLSGYTELQECRAALTGMRAALEWTIKNCPCPNKE